MTTATSSIPSTAPPPARAMPAYAWAALALVSVLLAYGLGAATDLEVRPLLRGGALALIGWAAAEDFRTRRLRNALTAPAAVLALAGAPAIPAALLGALCAPLPFLVIAVWRPGAMGMGDVKLAFVAGALVGLAALPMWWFATALAGAVLALIALVRGGPGATLAYGPALVAGLGPLLW